MWGAMDEERGRKVETRGEGEIEESLSMDMWKQNDAVGDEWGPL